ncbi:ABC transporter substrate-binding protein [Bifidobacterium saguinibicoloris]|uniref:ABC transporter substrate-binding protein n=1 Tax=Bifidobacterium saguinibicoloris TaxID=2834433 RepID=UPI001F36CDA4|nr:sugar ABC transporter substrate-binding protein [Bifidobacterium saguinibicoloris]
MKLLDMKKTMIASAAAVAMIVPLGACGSSSETTSTDPKDASGEITIWGWGNGMNETIAAFEKAYPKIKVKYSSTGTGADTSKALNNVIAAGKGAPDVSMMLSTDVSKFAQEGSISDLKEFGANDMGKDFAPGIWGQAQFGGTTYGMPIGGGPMVFFYNEEVFSKAGIDTPPTTWDEWYEDAKKIRALGDDYYITNNAGDRDSYSEFNAMLWQLAAQPFKLDGENLTIDLTGDKQVKKFIDFQQKLIDEDLVNTSIRNWTDDWFRSLSDGTTASLAVGAWMPTNLESSSGAAKGKWRAADIPQWDPDHPTNAEDGGSVFTIPSQSKNKAAAWAFINYATHGDGAQIFVDHGNFPALKSILNGDEFKNATNEYFGGQKVNEVLSRAAQMDSSSYEFLPFSTYAQSIFGDYISKAYQGETSLKKAVASYQDALIDYAKEQGYTVK